MNLSWQVGDVKITRIVESDAVIPGDGLILGASADAIKSIDWLAPHFATPEGEIKISFHALVVETPTRRIVVDTCVGNNKDRPDIPLWHQMQTSFLEHLITAGFAPETIDTVLCTHLHIDHVGWNTRLVDGAWVPTFANARYLVGKTEYDHWHESHGGPVASEQIFMDSIKPVWDAGLMDLVAKDLQICPEVQLVSTPGHTVGHVSVSIVSQGQSALITGDFVHHPCQLAHPDWGTHFDDDVGQGTKTRNAVFESLAGQETLVIGTHFSSPTAGHILRDRDAYRFKV